MVGADISEHGRRRALGCAGAALDVDRRGRPRQLGIENSWRMAVLSVPRPLQDRLGDAASASLVEMLRQLEEDQEERREVQKEHLFQLPEERFLRPAWP